MDSQIVGTSYFEKDNNLNDLEFSGSLEQEHYEDVMNKTLDELRNTASELRSAKKYRGRRKARKTGLLKSLKRRYPKMNLENYVQEFVQQSNIESIDELETLEIAKKIDNFSLKKLAGKVNKVAKVVGKGIKKVTIDATKRVLGATFLSPLIPLRPVMAAAIKAKGGNVTPATTLIDVATMFHNKVIKNNKLEEALEPDWYENTIEFNTNSIEELENYYAEQQNVDSDHVAVAVVTLVTTIISFVTKMIKEKKEKGGKVPKWQEEIASGAEQVMKGLEEKQEFSGAMQANGAPDVNQPLGGFKMTPMMYGIAAIAVISLIFIMKK